MKDKQFNRISTLDAQENWVKHVKEVADSLYPLANSWYMGVNIPGNKVFMPYVGGVHTYRKNASEWLQMDMRFCYVQREAPRFICWSLWLKSVVVSASYLILKTR